MIKHEGLMLFRKDFSARRQQIEHEFRVKLRMRLNRQSCVPISKKRVLAEIRAPDDRRLFRALNHLVLMPSDDGLRPEAFGLIGHRPDRPATRELLNLAAQRLR